PSCRHGKTPGAKTMGGFPTALHPTTGTRKFPTQVTAAHPGSRLGGNQVVLCGVSQVGHFIQGVDPDIPLIAPQYEVLAAVVVGLDGSSALKRRRISESLWVDPP